jgi:cytosine/adenosine deaminase-related metal-dependent hydrolase
MSSKGVINNPESEGYLRKAIETALEYDLTGDDILVGGVDPATRNRNIEETIDTWFNIATDYDIDIDVHIQDGGLLGQYTIERLADKMKKHGYEGRVTASHNFSLAHLPDWRVDELIATMKDVNLKTVTCYNSTRSNMPIKKLIKQGLSIGHGTDNHKDFVISHGDSDILRAALTEVNKLHGDRMEDKEYRWYETNEGLELIWDMITRQGASVLNLSGDYEIKEGEIADLLIFDQPSPQWSIINQAERSYVIKGGKIVAEDGKLESKYSEVE